MSANARTRLTAIITPLLPERYRKRINAHTVASVGTLSGPSVFIDYSGITHDGMPAGAMIDTFDVALVSDLTDFAMAEDDLDPDVRAFVRALDLASDIAWSAANKRSIGDYLAWVVTVSFPTASHQE